METGPRERQQRQRRDERQQVKDEAVEEQQRASPWRQQQQQQRRSGGSDSGSDGDEEVEEEEDSEEAAAAPKRSPGGRPSISGGGSGEAGPSGGVDLGPGPAAAARRRSEQQQQQQGPRRPAPAAEAEEDEEQCPQEAQQDWGLQCEEEDASECVGAGRCCCCRCRWPAELTAASARALPLLCPPLSEQLGARSPALPARRQGQKVAALLRRDGHAGVRLFSAISMRATAEDGTPAADGRRVTYRSAFSPSPLPSMLHSSVHRLHQRCSPAEAAARCPVLRPVLHPPPVRTCSAGEAVLLRWKRPYDKRDDSVARVLTFAQLQDGLVRTVVQW